MTRNTLDDAETQAPRGRISRVPVWLFEDEQWSRGLAWLVLALAAVQSVVAACMLVTGADSWGFALVGGLCSGVVMVPFLVTRTSVFSLWGPVALVVTLGTGVRGVAMATGFPDPEVVQEKFVRGYSFADLVWPSVVATLSVSFVVAGYLLARRWHPPAPPLVKLTVRRLSADRPTSRWLVSVVVSYAVVGAVATALYLRAVGGLGARINERRTVYESGGNFQSYGHWEFLAHAGVVALFVYLAWALQRRARLALLDWLALVLLAANGLAINLITTTRDDLLYISLGALLIVHLVRGRVGLPAIVTCAMVVVLGIGVLSGIRGGVGAGGLESGVSSAVLNRNGYDLSKTLTIIDAVPRKLPHAYGATMGRYVLAPIPRAVWPDKPAISEGVTVGREVYGLERTGIPPGLTAELVWNFGRVLAVVLSILVGFLLGLVERLVGGSRTSIPWLVSAALVFMPLGQSVMGVSLGQGISAAGQALALVTPLFLVSYLRSRRAQPEVGFHGG